MLSTMHKTDETVTGKKNCDGNCINKQKVNYNCNQKIRMSMKIMQQQTTIDALKSCKNDPQRFSFTSLKRLSSIHIYYPTKPVIVRVSLN